MAKSNAEMTEVKAGPNIPHGMVEVTQDEFYKFVNPRDIIIHNAPDWNVWETRSRVVVGRSWPSFRRPSDPHVYALTESARAAIALAEGRDAK